MKTDAINTIKEGLKETLTKNEKELIDINKEIKELTRKRDSVSDDIQALRHTLKLFGAEIHEEKRAIELEQINLIETVKKSIPDVAHGFLKQADKPLSGDELIKIFADRGREVNRSTLVSALYRGAKQKKRFKLFKPNRFGLIEWPDSKG